MKSEQEIQAILRDMMLYFQTAATIKNIYGVEDELFEMSKFQVLTSLQFCIEMLLVILEKKKYIPGAGDLRVVH